MMQQLSKATCKFLPKKRKELVAAITRGTKVSTAVHAKQPGTVC